MCHHHKKCSRQWHKLTPVLEPQRCCHRPKGGCDCSVLLLPDVVISDCADISTYAQPNTLQPLPPFILLGNVTTLGSKEINKIP